MDITHFKIKFIDEANCLLTNLDNVLIELEKDPCNKQHINEAFRVMHTIKGASGMYGFDHVVEVTHELESLYDIYRQNNHAVPQTLIEISFAAADHIRDLLSDEEFANLVNIQRHGALKTNIEAVKQTFNLPKTETNPGGTGYSICNTHNETTTWNIVFCPSDKLVKRAVNLVYTFQDLFKLGEYRIYQSQFQLDEEPYWNIFLSTDKPYDEIEGALLFIMDYCKIARTESSNALNSLKFNKQIIMNKEFDLETFMDQISTNNLKQAVQDATCINQNNNKLLEEANVNFHQGDTGLSLGNISNNLQSPLIINNEVTAQVHDRQKTTRINVDSSKLDTLMFLVSELVTSKSELLLALQKNNIQKATDTAEKIEKLSKLFSENALDIRLVSLHEMLNRFKRLIRDLSKQLGKSINFVTLGEETELDKNIIDNIGEPVMHLIRNCIDHGIESPEKRKEKGKPETGTIKFEAVKSGNFVYIFISDDGNGIDTNYVYNKAIEKGFIAPGTELSHDEIIDLIFLPGFSTAQNLTNVSGRGVGMDIVLKKIHEIRGEISVTSNFGAGTVFTLKLQQTISIIETLLIEADGITYAIPLEDIESCILETGSNIFDGQNRLLGYNGNLIPFINLRTTFNPIASKNISETQKLVIIKRSDKVYAIVVDNIVGEYHAVIKSLGSVFTNQKFLSGASLLGDGSIALLVDTDKLWYEIPSISQTINTNKIKVGV